MTTGNGAGKSVKFILDGKRSRGARGRDHLAGGQAPGHRHPASVLFARARLSRRRQLPRLHGGDRGRARAGGELHPQAGARHEGEGRLRARQDRAADGVRAADRRPARPPDAGARSAIEILGLGRPHERRPPAASASATRRRPTAAIRPWRSISTPASSAISVCAPAAKCRSTTSSAWPAAATAKRSCSISTIRWALRPASPAANACRPARPAR